MDDLLNENKKIYGNLAKIVSNQVKKEEVTVDQHKYERDYMVRMQERNRVVGLMELERNNLKIAQKIASA